MKRTIFLLAALLGVIQINFAQNRNGLNTVSATQIHEGVVNHSNIITYKIPLHRTVHIVSPEKIDYVDISTPNAIGDLPTDNIFRIKCNDSIMKVGDYFEVTLVSAFFIQTIRLIPVAENGKSDDAYVIKINPNEALQLNSLDKVSQQDFNHLAMSAMSKKRSIYNISSKAYGLEYWVNNIFTYGDFIILDITARNNTKLTYQVDDVKFRIGDKHTAKSVAQQELELNPIFSLYQDEGAKIRKGEWRNLYLFNRFTYPDDKVLNIELSEKEFSGRRISLSIDYNQILQSSYIN